MAEGFARHFAGSDLTFLSAGSDPAPQVNRFATQAMAEVGIDIRAAKPKHVSSLPHPVELVVAVCSHAAEQCAIPPAGAGVERWDLPDPAAAVGSDEEVLQVFRESRDEIEKRVLGLVARLKDQMGITSPS